MSSGNALVSAAALAVALALPQVASASLIGQSVTVTTSCFGCDNSGDTVLVSDAVELLGGTATAFGNFFVAGESLDIRESSIVITSPFTFSNVTFSFTGYSGTLLGIVSPPEGNDIDNVYNETILGGGSSFSFTVDSFGDDGSDAISIGLQFDDDDGGDGGDGAVVPLPAGFPLLLGALGGLALLRRRRD